jgi:uncharacterized membrane protein
MTNEIENMKPGDDQQDENEIIISQKENNNTWLTKAIIILAVLITVALVVLALIFLLDKDNTAMTEQIRDVFIIFMALVSLIIGAAMVVLIIQLATLINLLQNEIRPIIHSTNETVNTLKGTAQFLSDNLTEPVIKINTFAAKIRRIIKPSKR